MPVDIPRKNNFTLIRCIRAAVVLVRHCMDSSVQACFVPVKTFFESQDAVCLFFLISGLLVTASCERSPSYRVYAGKRLRRIFPLYLTAVVGAALILCLASSLPAARYFTDSRFWKYLFWNSLTLNFMQRTLPGVFEGNPYNASVNDALWTVKIELFFYVCLPLLCHILHRLKSRWKQNSFLVFLYILSFAYRLLCRKFASVLGMPLLNTLAMEAPGYFGPFVLGMLCYYNFDRFSRFHSGLLPGCCFLLCLLLIVLANCGFTGRIPDGIKYILLAYACLYAAFSCAFLHDRFQGPD
ncbi:MAG: acyltransferase [Treponema sp.]|nr:acyltransferase [Treponema sp.]